MPKLTPEIIAAAIEGYEAQRTRIDQKIAELRAALPGDNSSAPAEGFPQKRRKLSSAARARMAQAQRKRWADAKNHSEAPSPTASPKRRLSAAGRKRIIEATKKRWAAVRAAKAKEAENIPKRPRKTGPSAVTAGARSAQ